MFRRPIRSSISPSGSKRTLNQGTFINAPSLDTRPFVDGWMYYDEWMETWNQSHLGIKGVINNHNLRIKWRMDDDGGFDYSISKPGEHYGWSTGERGSVGEPLRIGGGQYQIGDRWEHLKRAGTVHQVEQYLHELEFRPKKPLLLKNCIYDRINEIQTYLV